MQPLCLSQNTALHVFKFQANFAGLAMVTNAPYYSFEDINFKKSAPFIVVVSTALGFALTTVHPPVVVFRVFVAYGLSCHVIYAYRKAKGLQTGVIAAPKDELEERGLH
jgi:CDP-diacylglycerol---serine O-phosphatidyltransferase